MKLELWTLANRQKYFEPYIIIKIILRKKYRILPFKLVMLLREENYFKITELWTTWKIAATTLMISCRASWYNISSKFVIWWNLCMNKLQRAYWTWLCERASGLFSIERVNQCNFIAVSDSSYYYQETIYRCLRLYRCLYVYMYITLHYRNT